MHLLMQLQLYIVQLEMLFNQATFHTALYLNQFEKYLASYIHLALCIWLCHSPRQVPTTNYYQLKK